MNLCSKLKLFSTGLFLFFLFSAFLPYGWGAERRIFYKKEIPEITFSNLSPPYKHFAYFLHNEFFPFEYSSSSLSLINAWWLAEASTLAYADEAFVKERFREAGLNRIRFIDHLSTQCFIASNRRFAVIAFRGSEIWKRNGRINLRQIMADFKTNIDIRLSDWSGGGKVHSGFKAALDDVWDELSAEMRDLKGQGIKIWMTGHSLGAALATLAFDRMEDVQGLYTFGSPRVGDKDFQSGFKQNAFRVVNGNDIVEGVPFEGRYRHVGELIFIDEKGHIHHGARRIGESDGEFCFDPCNEPESPAGNENFSSAVFVPSSIRNHVPLLYSIFLWNGLVENLNNTLKSEE